MAIFQDCAVGSKMMQAAAVFPMASFSSFKLAHIRKRRCIVLPSPSLQRKSLVYPSQKGAAERLPSSLGLPSPPKCQMDNTLSPIQMDRLSLNDEEFEESMEAISSDFGPDYSKMDVKEFKEYCKRRGKYVAACSKRLSDLVGNVDLVTT